jgi:hypothetical protein
MNIHSNIRRIIISKRYILHFNKMKIYKFIHIYIYLNHLSLYIQIVNDVNNYRSQIIITK